MAIPHAQKCLLTITKPARHLVLAVILLSLLSACGDDRPVEPLSRYDTLLAFGDSLTYGTGGRGVSYPAHLSELTGLKVVNAGVPGEVSAKGLQRLPALLQQHQPALVILCHGGNDILRRLPRNRMQKNLSDMVKLIRNAGAQVLLIGVPEFSVFLDSSAQHDAVAEAFDLLYEDDILPSILKNPALKSDQIHPNAEGYQQMAVAIQQRLQTAELLP